MKHRIVSFLILLIMFMSGCSTETPVVYLSPASQGSPAPSAAVSGTDIPTGASPVYSQPPSPSPHKTAETGTSAPTAIPTDPPSPAPTNTTEAQVRARCREILNEYGATIDGIYAYINNTDPLQRLYYSSSQMPGKPLPAPEVLALHLLETGKGVCYHFSALTYFLLQEAGFEAQLITGIRNRDNAEHRWTLVKTDDGWYHFDPQHKQKLLTDSQKQREAATNGNGMHWDTEKWPATPA